MQERRPLVSTLRPSRAGRRAPRLAIPVVAAVIVGADQASKTWALHALSPYKPRHIGGPVNLVLTYNRGAAFSLGTGVTPILEGGVIVAIVGLLAFSRRASRSAPWPVGVGLGLLLGGAIGNLVDRVLRDIPGHPGSVVDFIQGVSWWPVFNVADASIVVGVLVLVIAYWRQHE
ncbi:MAG: signal peptidase II [Acidimicrobiales bacterium]|nr:signal peptidase II [Acidimicrobiales bacterium]